MVNIMIIRNGLRAFAGNFMLVWKHLLYVTLVTLFCSLLVVWSFNPIVDLLQKSGWIGELKAFVELIYTSPSEVADAFNNLGFSLYRALFSDNAVWGNYALSLFLIFFLPNFLYYIGEYVLGVLTGAKMSSLLNLSYSTKLISTIGRSVLYSLWKMLLSIPFLIIVIGLTIGYATLTKIVSLAWLLLPIFIGLILLIIAFRYVFFVGFLPVATMGEKNIVASFAEGIDNYTDGFMKKVLYFWGLFLLEFAGIVFIALFTIGAGLIIVFPATIFLNTCCSFTNYFTTKKENFYVGENTIIKPL